MNKITEIVNGRICAILLSGASILELEKEILFYKDIDICWCGLNNYSKIENNILSKINKHIEILQDCSEVKYMEDYENQIRVPQIESFLNRNENNFLLTSPEIIINWFKINRLDLFTKYSNKIGLFDYGIHYSVPNSLTLLLMYLGRYSNAKFIILFGCDSYSGNSGDINAILNSYYNPEEIIKERLIGFKDGTVSGLMGEMKSFDNSILNYYTKFAWQNNIQPPPVYNCSCLTSISAFKVINYVEVRQICGLLDNDTELVTQEITDKMKTEVNKAIELQTQKRETLLTNISELRKILEDSIKSKIKNTNKNLEQLNQNLQQIKESIENLPPLNTTTYSL